jgi:hypothetical protein
MKRYYLIGLFWLTMSSLFSQIDPDLLKVIPRDSSIAKLNMDAVFNRPMLSTKKLPVTLGGYMEVDWQKSSTDGVDEGHQFQFRRFTIFMASTITSRIRFLSELEFEDGTKEIALEFAAIDIELLPLMNFRAGIITNPIGAFNQNHDGPKWEFTDRPISATQLLPATFSNPGFGFYGKTYKGAWMFGYEAYLTNGLDNSIIENEENKTFLPAAKENPFRFEESFNGIPLVTAKLALRHDRTGEFGFSYMGGIYNKFREEGVIIDEKRHCNVFAIDYNHTIPKLNTSIIAEWVWIFVDVPATYTEQFGNKQYGGFIDIVQPLLKRRIITWDDATLNAACRLEFADWNSGYFESTGSRIGDETWSIMPSISFRPTNQTVIRFNYRYQRSIDIFGNPPEVSGTFSFGLSTYF